MNKVRLLTPGPCPVPSRVRLAIARPVIHHRSDEYHRVHAEVVAGLRQVFRTSGDVFLFASSGTGVMESAVVNLLSAGDTAIVICGGKFGERWAEICKAHGVIVAPVDVDWGKAVDPASVEKALVEIPDAAAVFATLCETSTGTKTDIRALAAITREKRAVLVTDATSGLCVSELRMDAWGVDVAVAGCQKGLMLPTGLGVAVVGSAKARGLVEKSRLSKYYFDWKAAGAAATKNETAWSAPASLVIGLKESLDLIMAEGLDAVLARHARLARAGRAGAAALGLELLAKDSPAEGLTALIVPEGIQADALRERMAEQYGVLVAGGQGPLRGKIIRIAHMGYADALDVIAAISALEMALADLGWPVEIGKGVSAAERELRNQAGS